MKRLYILLLLFIISLGISAQDYYWYKGKKIYFEQFAEQAADMPLLNKDLLLLESKSSDRSESVTTNRFLVKLKNASDYPLLLQYANTYNVQSIIACHLPLWYILSCSENTTYTALMLANLFYESNSFAAAEPEFKDVIFHNCVNDTLFSQQWYLNNTGQNGNDYIGWDINYCDAHAVTSGNSGVKIALIDVGVDSTHEDIPNPALRYDMLSMTNQDSLYGTGSYGTAAAGIIAARTNNITGIAGIAPDCSLMSISIPDYDRVTSTLLADAIIYAVNNDAEVINTPWYSLASSEYIYDAIGYAQENGRNGKGSVVVLGSGNWNGPIMFPAETHDENIVVGAISECGTRKYPGACDNNHVWGSCYGHRLDVVAPGEIIVTGDNDTIYNKLFYGTSASCAQVSAIAGLILSINPNLSGKEVGDIINSTARKVGPYSYDSIAPNGNWDFEMGYGLVDAYAAVKKAQLSTISISGPTYLCDTYTTYRVYGAPDSATYQWHLSNRVIFDDIIGSKTNDTVVIGFSKLLPGINDSIVWRDGDNNTKAHIDPPVPAIPLPDSAMLSVTISKDGMSYTKQKMICSASRGTPEVVCSDTSTYWQRYTSRIFTITNCHEVPDTDLRWTIRLISPDYGQLWPTTDVGREISFIPIFVGTYEVSVVNRAKDCTPNTTTKNYIVVYDMPAKSMRKTAAGIKDAQQDNQQSASKILRNGQLFIIHEGKEYNATGFRTR